ncbi:MAG: flagellin [Roseburia sp.]|nr:flagellin [Roseburia sp.]
MVVQHNLTAMNSNRMLGITQGNQAKTSEKLASGYRINRAGDDAAGLKISEKMRSQIRGLNKASTNAQDGISLIQTAEGALNEAHSILQRMNELAVQGANDTNESIDRDAINQELNALVEELDRISETTQFNKQNLLDGSFSDKNLQVGANANQKIAISIENMDAKSLGLKEVTGTIEYEAQMGVIVSGVNYEGMSAAYDMQKAAASNLAKAVSSIQGTAKAKYTSANYAIQANGKYKTLIDGTEVSTKAKAISADQKAAFTKISADLRTNFEAYQVTAETSAKALSSYDVDGNVRVDNYDVANKSITAIQNAINKVSGQRSALGALQNRLEHTVANLDNVSENTQAAESRIRDTDMAEEMVEYSKNNILAQAGQSMLAQANQSTQGVLSLLQ